MNIVGYFKASIILLYGINLIILFFSSFITHYCVLFKVYYLFTLPFDGVTPPSETLDRAGDTTVRKRGGRVRPQPEPGLG